MTRITDAQLCDLIASYPDDMLLRAELRRRVQCQIFRVLPNATGRCPHGKRIEWDSRGAFSSGYPIHFTEDADGKRSYERGYCDMYGQAVNDPDAPDRARLLTLVRTL